MFSTAMVNTAGLQRELINKQENITPHSSAIRTTCVKRAENGTMASATASTMQKQDILSIYPLSF